MISKHAILQAFQFRHACKAFDPERKITDTDFRFLLECGRLSPSSFGYEPWRFLVIQDMALREKLRAVSWGAQGQSPPRAMSSACSRARTTCGLVPSTPST